MFELILGGATSSEHSVPKQSIICEARAAHCSIYALHCDMILNLAWQAISIVVFFLCEAVLTRASCVQQLCYM